MTNPTEAACINMVIAEALGKKTFRIYAMHCPRMHEKGNRDTCIDCQSPLAVWQESPVRIPDYTADATALLEACRKLGYAPCIIPNGKNQLLEPAFKAAVIPYDSLSRVHAHEYWEYGSDPIPILATALADAIGKGQE